MKISLSWRYFVFGVYVDRSLECAHYYPIPFVRFTYYFKHPPRRS